MVSAILALLAVVPPLLGLPTPLLLPAIGFALGYNAVLKERRLPSRRRAQRALGWLGVGLNGLVVALYLVAKLYKK